MRELTKLAYFVSKPVSTLLHSNTSLHNYAWWGDFRRVKEEYEKNPQDLNRINNSGFTPLDDSYDRYKEDPEAHDKIIKFLREKGGLTGEEVKKKLAVENEKLNLNFNTAISSGEIEQIKCEKEIGRGGFGVVYKAQYKKMDVAVKIVDAKQIEILNIPIVTIPPDPKIFFSEAVIFSQLRSEYVVRFYEASFDKPPYVLVMEYMEKGSVKTVLAQEANISQKIKYSMALDAARGVKYLHSFMPVVIHGDLKCGNILVDKNYHAKISDFGLSKLKLQEKTVVGPSAGGTPGWEAPEVRKGEKNSKESDSYSFGVVLWEFSNNCTLSPPKNIDSQDESVQKCVKDFPKMAKLITECCWKDRNKRPGISVIVDELSNEFQSKFGN